MMVENRPVISIDVQQFGLLSN